MTPATPMKIVLDTDIGSDVDDLLALAMLLGSPECDLTAVSTVYGDTMLRARMVRRAYRLARRPAPPVAAGARQARSGRPVWWAGHEGALMPDLAAEPVDEALDAAALLRTGPTIAAIGPLTNVADALVQPHGIERLVIMGGDFASDEPEHNIKCDVAAAQATFHAGVPVLATGIDQTKRVVLDDDSIAAIRSSGVLGELLAAEIHQFRAWLGRPDSPHDPIAALAPIRPDLFTVARGRIQVDSDGVTTLQRQDDGPHQVVVDLDPPAVLREIVRRVCLASGLRWRSEVD
ncbi:nucleoside hydrolase [Actinoplanes sp. CA-142083]|uniref:nucleoside hydrolase n=1 Tax=Actinoplanes sp. CA-142083 TaxID=3239903 RepID=UPI003D8CCE32